MGRGSRFSRNLCLRGWLEGGVIFLDFFSNFFISNKMAIKKNAQKPTRPH